jgi:hypothetical protein
MLILSRSMDYFSNLLKENEISTIRRISTFLILR